MSDTTTTPTTTPADREVEHVDVLIVGAGLSGVGAACRISTERPGISFVVLEARDDLGGTWDLFQYPGIRSDSDMFTLGYGFRPWDGEKSIASGESILEYIRETAREYRIGDHIRYQRRVTALSWDSAAARWTAEVTRTGDEPGTERITASFVYSCTGYYRYDQGYLPDFPGTDRYTGRLVHPQHWPEDLELRDQHVVVIGSGATAVTLVPSLTETAGHVTMLQRSPSYITSLPDTDAIADWARRWLPARVAHEIIKWKNVAITTGVYQLSRRVPSLVRRILRWRLERQLPDDYDTETHFTPDYDPWDQRLCLVPNNDLFRAITDGDASMVTDTIDTFTETGLRLGSGRTLDADIIVSATGLNLLMMGGIEFTVDGEHIDVSDTVAYKGMMLSGVPNFAFAVGYVNASWTLKVDLVSDYVCRLLAYMDEAGHDIVMPQPPDPSQPLRPLIDLESGYVKRSIDELPRQGSEEPWALHQNYLRDISLFRRGDVDDEGVRFIRRGATGDEDHCAT